jgi:hypothetical protein
MQNVDVTQDSRIAALTGTRIHRTGNRRGHYYGAKNNCGNFKHSSDRVNCQRNPI